MNTLKTLTVALCLTISPITFGNSSTVDNSDNGAIAIGTWTPSAGTNPHEGDSLYSTGNSTSYKWTVPIATSGEYDVQVWWTYYNNRTRDAQYTFNTANGTETVNIDQRNASQAGQWVSLGRYNLSAGTTTITVSNPSGVGTLNADAIQTVSDTGSTTSGEAITLDTTDSSTNAIGTWTTSAGGAPYGNDSLYSQGNNTRYSWALPIATSGEYDVQVWWTYYNNRTQDAQYTFNTANGTETVNIDQRNASKAGQWVSLGRYNLNAGTTTITVNNPSGAGTLSADAVQAVKGGGDTGNDDTANNDNSNDDTGSRGTSGTFIDNFTDLDSFIGYVSNNIDALPDVSYYLGRYHAVLTENPNNITLHFRKSQGRLDAKEVSFPFKVIVRNVGIGRTNNSQNVPSFSAKPYIFAGVQVHVSDLESRNSSHVVVGHRGGTHSTIEGKNTVNGTSYVNDEGKSAAPFARADIMIEGTADRQLIVSWQQPNSTKDNWELYRGTGKLPGTTPQYGPSVYVGLITYAQGSNGLPFVGTADKLIIED